MLRVRRQHRQTLASLCVDELFSFLVQFGAQPRDSRIVEMARRCVIDFAVGQNESLEVVSEVDGSALSVVLRFGSDAIPRRRPAHALTAQR